MLNFLSHPHDNSPDFTSRVLNYVLLFLACAFIGWLWEVILTFIQHGHYANRGVLHGPWLPIYGFGGLIITIFLRHFNNNPILVFLAAAVTCGLMEYLTGWYLETFKHMKWWDYSDLPLNINGRVCLMSVTAFGLCGLLLTYAVTPLFFDLFNHIPHHAKMLLCVVVMSVFISDAFYSSYYPNTGTGITTEIIHNLKLNE